MEPQGTGYVDVDGCPVHYCDSNSSQAPVVLIHGNGAHRLWWSHVADALADQHRVVCVDLSGHGNSGRRDAYGPDIFARDVRAVVAHLGLEDALLVGHSVGGRVAAVAAATWPRLFRGVVMLDTAFFGPGHVSPHRHQALVPMPDAESLRQRFRLLPPQPLPPWDVIASVVDYSMHKTAQGWTWKFDPAALRNLDNDYVNSVLGSLTCPVTFAYGEESSLDGRAVAQRVLAALPEAVVVPVPGGHHHLPLDSPAACVQIIGSAARPPGRRGS